MIYEQEEFDNLLGKSSVLTKNESWNDCLPLVKELEQSIMNKLR